MRLEFSVLGIPVPQGSKRAFNGAVVDSNIDRLKPWRQMVSAAASEAMGDAPWADAESAFKIGLTFSFPRPRSHFGRKGLLPSKVGARKIGRPDLDKLVRAALDSCTDAGVWMDDSQVVGIVAVKVYDTLGGLECIIEDVV